MAILKKVVVLNGKIINVGEWDYRYTETEGEQVALNPLPKGAVTEEREMEYTNEYGWREVGFVPELIETEKLRLEMAQANAELFELILAMSGGK